MTAPLVYNVFRSRGGLAQLGERLNGIEEVSGSIPLSSTDNEMARREIPVGFFMSLEEIIFLKFAAKLAE